MRKYGRLKKGFYCENKRVNRYTHYIIYALLYLLLHPIKNTINCQ